MNIQAPLELSAVLLSGLAVSLVTCAMLRRMATRIGFLDKPSGRKAHEKPIALGGGIGIALGTLVTAFVAFHFFGFASDSSFDIFKIIVAVAGGLAIFSLGLFDDIRGVNPYVRLAVEVAIAVILYYAGFRITAFVYFPLANLFLTVFWFVFLVNAFNLLDTTDGLSGGTAAIICAIMLITLRDRLDPLLALLLVAFAGSLVGFLVHNFPPARIFMGDAGSLFIGYILALASIAATYYSPQWGNDPVLAMATPLLLFAVPLYDTSSVVLIRIRSRKSIFTGDRNHLPHRLMALGLKRREVVFIVYLLTAITSSTAVYMGRLSRTEAMLLIAQMAAIFVVLFILETAGDRKK